MYKILLINGHPDPSPERFCSALCEQYLAGAAEGGHETRLLSLGRLDFPLIRRRQDFEDDAPPACIVEAQDLIHWADHIVLVHPLWLGAAPALLKGFLEQTFRSGFAISKPDSAKRGPMGLLKGRSIRIIVTMGMPGAFYRLAFGAFGVRGMERSIFRLSGMGPIRHNFIGMVEGPAEARKAWLHRMAVMGRSGA